MSFVRWLKRQRCRSVARPGRDCARSLLQLEELESRTVPSATTAGSEAVMDVVGALTTQAETDAYQVNIIDGVLNVRVDWLTEVGGAPRLILRDQQGRELVRSEGVDLGVGTALLVESLPSGTYFLEVSAPTPLSTTLPLEYELHTHFEPFPSLRVDDYRVGDDPRAVALEDVNDDGRLDVVTANRASADVSVLFGGGDGGFAPQTRLGVGAGPVGLSLADVNADGWDDIVTANRDSNDVSVLLGQGDGTFRAQQRFAVGAAPSAVEVGDCNGDNILDLVTANSGSADVSVLLGNGDGSFQPQRRFAVGTAPAALALADIDGDAALDLVTANYASFDVSVLLNDGAGTFQEQRRVADGVGPTAVLLGDINGDGRPDLLTTSRSRTEVRVRLGNGDGSFQEQHIDYFGGGCSALVLGDVNGDNQPDLLCPDEFSDTVIVLLGDGAGSFQEQRRLGVGNGPVALRQGDVNGDGRCDIVTVNRYSADVTVLLSEANGFFQARRRFTYGVSPGEVSVADFNGDELPDLLARNTFNGSLTLLLGNGTGAFLEQRDFPSESGGVQTFGDVNGDGFLDIVSADEFRYDVAVLLGNGDGTFQEQQRTAVGTRPTAVALADVDGDGWADVVLANSFGAEVSVLLSNDDATFREPQRFAVGAAPTTVRVGDVDGDHRLDLITVNSGSNEVSVLLGDGTGFFRPQRRFAVGADPTGLSVDDLNGDGQLDLLVANRADNDVSLLLGKGDGTFRPQLRLAVGVRPTAITVGDVNGDGRSDVLTANVGDVSVLLGKGDGSFQPQRRVVLGANPSAVGLGDVNDDGRLDLLTNSARDGGLGVFFGNGDGTFLTPRLLTNDTLSALGDVNGDGRMDLLTNGVGVLLGNGDGSFQNQQIFPVATTTGALVQGDVNRDGRLDLVTTSPESDQVFVLLGNGDGSFQNQPSIAVKGRPQTPALADVNGDSLLDLVTLNRFTDDVSVLLGNGDGTFQKQRRCRVGESPVALAVGDIDGDGWLDLLTANDRSDDISVLLGNGDGTFQPQQRFAIGRNRNTATLADVNGDRRLDLVTTNIRGNNLLVLLGNGDGSFQPQQSFIVGERPTSVLTGDVNGDGNTDLVTANLFSYDASVLLGNGDGSFQPQRRFSLRGAVCLGDINGDGHPDLVGDQGLTVLLGDGQGNFLPASVDRFVELRHTPRHGDMDHDGIADLVVLNDRGDLLFRRGLAGGVNLFAAPVTLKLPRSARDLTLVATVAGLVVAVSDTQGDTVSVYDFRAAGEGRVALTTQIHTGLLPQRLQVADLNDDQLDDLVIAGTLDGTLTIAWQQPAGTFMALPLLNGRLAPSDITLDDLDGDGRLDVLCTSQFSGQVSVLYNDANHSFTHAAYFQAGAAFPDVTALDGVRQPQTLNQSVSLATGDFNEDSRADVVAVNRGSDRFDILLGTPGGGLTNPSAARRFSTSAGLGINDQAGEVRAADFDRDGHLDVAILMENRGELWLYCGDGHGGFALVTTVPVGNVPTSFSLAELNDDNNIDLLVGNGFGDVLSILGNGDGTFRPFVRADNRVPFVATDLNGDGRIDVLLAEQARDRVSARLRGKTAFTPGAFQRDGGTGLIGPGDVLLANVDGKNGKDLLFANTGSNNVLVYLRRADGSFAERPLSFFAGTNPTGLHAAQLNDDNRDGHINHLDLLDLAVANQGSNDVSVLLGSRSDTNNDGKLTGQDLFRLGPRLQTDEAGPTMVTSRQLNDDNKDSKIDDRDIPDLIAVSPQGNSATALFGVGRGFFDDNATTLALGGVPVDIVANLVLLASGDIVALNFQAEVVNFVTSINQDSTAFAVVDLPGVDDPLFFVATTDGSVLALVPTDGAYLTLDRPGDGLDSPSALRILRDSSGFDVYVSDSRDAGLSVIRFGLDELQLTLEPAGSGLPLAATLTTSLAGTNSLLVSNAPLLTDVLLDTNVVLGVEDVLTEPIFVNGAVVGSGERLLAELEEQLDPLDNQPPAPPVVTPNTLEQYLFGLEEAMRQLGWKQVPGRAVPPSVAPLGDWWHWLERGRDALDWLMSPPPAEESPEADPQELSCPDFGAEESNALPARSAGLGSPVSTLPLVGGCLLAATVVSDFPGYGRRRQPPRPPSWEN